MEKIPMTAEGYQALDAEMKRLKTEERPAVIAAIAEARAHGDLSENAEYHAAKERQAFIEGRLLELEDKIARAQIIDVTKLSGKQVKFGATVNLLYEDSGAKSKYKIVG
jgi:transcription elongation factor GreA